MSLSMSSLLMFEDDVPEAARSALREAVGAPLEERQRLLEVAAHALYRETHLDCADARELVGL
jgi:hypothetical protein